MGLVDRQRGCLIGSAVGDALGAAAHLTGDVGDTIADALSFVNDDWSGEAEED